MSRLSFILAVTLLVVAGSMVFMMTFDREDDATMAADKSSLRALTRCADALGWRAIRMGLDRPGLQSC